MILGRKIVIYPTSEQENLFRRTIGCCRFVYNYFLRRNQEQYQLHKQDTSLPSYLSDYSINKEVTALRRDPEYSWLSKVSSTSLQLATAVAHKAMLNYFKKKIGKPHYKSKKRSKMSYHTRYAIPSERGIKFEKIGIVKCSTKLPKFKKYSKHKFMNTYISYDGNHWYFSFSYDTNSLENCKHNKSFIPHKYDQLTDQVLGIDLGIKTYAYVSNQDGSVTYSYKNINKSKKIKRIEKRHKHLQRLSSRKLENNTKYRDSNGKPYYIRPLWDCKNLQKSFKLSRKLGTRLANIRLDYIHQITSQIAKTKPSEVRMEDLNIRGMMRNKHLARSIQQCNWYQFRSIMNHKCNKFGIKFTVIDRFYASSKTCSKCGHKKNISLNDRIYVCDHCGLIIDRDLNAAINLANTDKVSNRKPQSMLSRKRKKKLNHKLVKEIGCQ